MSTISSEAERLYPPKAVDCHGAITIPVYTSDDLAEAYMDGAERQPTDEEIEAVAETVWNKVMVPNGHRPWSESQECVMKADFIDVARTALETAQGKATEE